MLITNRYDFPIFLVKWLLEISWTGNHWHILKQLVEPVCVENVEKKSLHSLQYEWIGTLVVYFLLSTSLLNRDPLLVRAIASVAIVFLLNFPIYHGHWNIQQTPLNSRGLKASAQAGAQLGRSCACVMLARPPASSPPNPSITVMRTRTKEKARRLIQPTRLHRTAILEASVLPGEALTRVYSIDPGTR